MRRLAAFFSILLVAGGAWLLLRWDRNKPTDAERLRPETEAGSREQSHQSSKVALPPEIGEANDEAQRAPKLVRREVASGRLQQVQVVHALSGAPVEGAEILCWPAPQDLTKLSRNELDALERDVLASRWGEVLRRHGTRFVADSNGCADVVMRAPPSFDEDRPLLRWKGDWPYIVAVSERHYGLCFDVAKSPRLTLRVREERHFDVLVLDTRSAPVAETTVCVDFFNGFGNVAWYHTSRLEGDSGPDGRVRFHHIQQYISRYASSVSDGRSSCSVALMVPGFDGPEVVFDNGAWPEEEIVLQVPPSARLEVQLLGDVPEDAVVVLECVTRSEKGEAVAPAPDRQLLSLPPNPSLHRAVAGRTAEFHRVAPSRVWRAWVRSDGVELARSENFEGPTLPGGSAIQLIELPRRLRCRLLDENAIPLRSVETTVLCLGPDEGVKAGFLIQSDAEGRLRWPLPANVRSNVVEFQISTRSPWPGRDGGKWIRVRSDHHGSDAEPTWDFSDLTLRDRPILARGRLRNGAGDEQVILSAFAVRFDSTGRLDVHLRSTGASTFEVRGQPGTAPYSLNLECETGKFEGQFAADQEFIDAVVSPAKAGISANFVHAEDRLLSVEVTLADVEGRSFAGSPARTQTGTQILWYGLPVGRYDFAARLLSASDPFLIVRDVEIAYRGKADPRLVDLSLPETKTLSFRVSTPDGTLQPESSPSVVFLRRSVGGEEWEGQRIFGSLSNLELAVSAAGPHDVRLCVPGYLPHVAFGVDDEIRCLLEPAPRLPVKLISSHDSDTTEYCARVRRSDLGVIGQFTVPGAVPDNFDPDGWIRWTPLRANTVVELPASSVGHGVIEVREVVLVNRGVLPVRSYAPVEGYVPIPCFVDSTETPASPLEITIR